MEHFGISVLEKELAEYPENLQISGISISNNNKSTLLTRNILSGTFTTLKYLKSNTLCDQSFTSQNPHNISLHTG